MIEIPFGFYLVLLASLTLVITLTLAWCLGKYNERVQRKANTAIKVQLKLEELDRLHYILMDNHKRLVTKVDTLLEHLDD